MATRLSVIRELARNTSPEEIAASRAALQTIAERVFAADLYSRVGFIGLRPTVDGFGQPEILDGGERRRARIVKNTIVVQRDTHETRHELTTLGAAAEAVGVELGIELPYETHSPLDPNTSVAIREDVGNAMAVAFNFTASALERVRRAVWHTNPSIYQLWPEHFDLAVKIGDVMIGGSLGDDERHGDRKMPYLYIAPTEVPEADGFWNEPYGAAIGFDELRSPDHAFAFFTTGFKTLGLL